MMSTNMPMQSLTQLRDIHLPPPITWWPLAPGWYVLLLSIILVCTCIALLIKRYYVNGRAKREALRLLTMYQQQQLNSAQVSELLKRVALAYYPREQVAGLHGEAWITFLNSTAQVDFNEVRAALLVFPYQISQEKDVNELYRLARAWIKQQRGAPCLN